MNGQAWWLLRIGVPFWAYPDSPATPLVPAKASDSTSVGFMCGSVKYATDKPEGLSGTTGDLVGRASRMFPLLLADQVAMKCSFRVEWLCPKYQGGAFLLSGYPFRADDVLPALPGLDYLVLLDLDARSYPWIAKFSAIRSADSQEVNRWQAPVDVNDMRTTCRGMLSELWRFLRTLPSFEPVSDTPILRPPQDGLDSYIKVLDQALLLRVATTPTITHNWLSNTQGMLEYLLNLAERFRSNLPLVLLVLAAFDDASRIEPNLVGGMFADIERLCRDSCLAVEVTEFHLGRLRNATSQGSFEF